MRASWHLAGNIAGLVPVTGGSEMGNLALNQEGAISGANGVGALDALDVSSGAAGAGDDMTPMDQNQLLPWSFFDARATTSTATLEPPELQLLSFPELLQDTSPPDSSISSSPSLSPDPSPTSLSFDFNHLDFHHPLFTHSTTAANSIRRETNHAIGDDAYADSSAHNVVCNGPTVRNDQVLPRFYTFFCSPSTSTTSLATSCYSSDLTSCLSQETKPAMPGATLAAPAAGAGYPPDMHDYFAGPTTTDDTADKMSTDGKQQPRPMSVDGRNRRSISPIFTLWTRRNQHQQHDGSNRSSTESKPNSANSSVHKRTTRSRSGSNQRRHSQAGGVVPQMTRQEFEALPLAIQRKYFSTLERLRFAQDSGRVDGISQHYDDISQFRRRKARQDRSVSEHLVGRARRQPFLESQVSFSDSSPSYGSLPDKIKRKEFTREEQVVLARRLRASVILDAADEAICKINRRASRRLHSSDKPFGGSSPPRPVSMDSHDAVRRSSDQSHGRDVPQSFYDSFRWLDEEDDLDLSLFLDDYHANLRDNLPSPAKQQRPSFRRHLSISKIPFGRNSISVSRPGTKDASTPISPAHSPSGSATSPLGHPRRKSRALSLITPKHMPQDSITGFDPAAAHYQDPEARLKLRVYLASPQKFDEAIEFGFPSADVLSAGSVAGRDGETHSRRPSRHNGLEVSNMHTFLADEDDDDENGGDGRLSLNSDLASMGDPDSPKTPQAFDNKPVPRATRPLRLVSTEPALGDTGGNFMESGGYAQAPASSREMTLRMTLTRPDLRANEDQIYGWQQTQGIQPGRKSTTLGHIGTENSATYIGNGANKDSMDRMPVNFDPWGPIPADKGVMKRIWNRVRRA